MDEGDLMEVNLTDLDLNQEPADASFLGVARYGSVLNELETSHNWIEERIRHLQAVAARARQRQMWRQSRNNVETRNSTSEMMMVDEGQQAGGNANTGIVEDRGKGCKRDSSYLVANALGIDFEDKKANKDEGSFYDCNICLDLAREPVLTCCGHLFCWPCFYQVSKVDSTNKECPVCKGQVSDSSVIPIYGNGDTNPQEEFGFTVPPRPRARRVESVRQQHVTQGLSHVPVAEALRRIRISIGAINIQTQVQEGSSAVYSSGTDPQAGYGTDSAAGPPGGIHQVSRVLSESAASLSSLSSALSNAERLVEDLETAINNQWLRNHARAMIVNATNSSSRLSIARQHQNQSHDLTGVPSASLLNATSSHSTDVSGSIPGLINSRIASNVTLPTASVPYISSQRRLNLARILDRDNPDSREARRRRLN